MERAQKRKITGQKEISGGQVSRQKKDCICLGISILCFFLLAITIVLMYFNRNDWKQSDITLGLLFWIFLICGGISQFALWLSYKRWLKVYKIRRKRKRNPGIIRFFSDRNAIIADIAMIVMFIVAIVIYCLTEGIAEYIAIAFFIFALCIHCILNSKLYYHALNQDKILNRLLRKKEKKERHKG